MQLLPRILWCSCCVPTCWHGWTNENALLHILYRGRNQNVVQAILVCCLTRIAPHPLHVVGFRILLRSVHTFWQPDITTRIRREELLQEVCAETCHAGRWLLCRWPNVSIIHVNIFFFREKLYFTTIVLMIG